MDYSKYYLKNYLKQQNTSERGYDNQSETSRESYYAQSDEDASQDYRVDESVEIEVTPQLTGMVQTNYQLDNEESPIIDIIPQSYDRYGSRRKGWLMTLAIITCVLLTVVVGDFATGGALLAGISVKNNQAMPTVNYYAVVLKTCDTYSIARMYAEQQRLMGGAGYILKDGEKYALIGDIYDDLADANSVVNNNEGSRLINIEVKEVDFDSLFKESSPLFRSMGGYCSGLLSQLDVIADDLTASKIDKTKALENIEVIKDNLEMQYNQLSAEVGDDKNSALLIADIDATLGILSNLLNTSLSRPNLVCDIRYSKVQMIINYRQLVESLTQSEASQI
ncbi:MAG: hypothetical protein K2J75_01810 [Clostridia bacterium]|nr:hypothetical protein [Clostridia bacterium]